MKSVFVDNEGGSWPVFLEFLAANGIGPISDDITEQEMLYHFITKAQLVPYTKYIWYYDLSPNLTSA